VTSNQYPLILKYITDLFIGKTLIATRTLTASTAVHRGLTHIDNDLGDVMATDLKDDVTKIKDVVFRAVGHVKNKDES
jgi:hypothetical protein